MPDAKRRGRRKGRVESHFWFVLESFDGDVVTNLKNTEVLLSGTFSFRFPNFILVYRLQPKGYHSKSSFILGPVSSLMNMYKTRTSIKIVNAK